MSTLLNHRPMQRKLAAAAFAPVLMAADIALKD
jgi:hypothetical protein